jgi:hypothetical protein
MKRLALILSLLVAPKIVFGGDAGTTAADFLRLGVGPRAVAMGDAQVALADDVYATYWNPAGLTQLTSQELGFAHTSYVEGINYESFAYAYPHVRLGTFAASLNYLNIGGFPGYDAVGQPRSDVAASDMNFGVSYARPLYKEERYGTELSVGLTGKWIRETLDQVSASAYAADLGVLFNPGIKWGEFLNGWKTGLALRNVGTKVRYDRESFALPRTLSAGLSYTGHWRDESVTLATDLNQTNAGAAFLGIGLEVCTLQSFVLRGGYSTEGDLGNGLRLGAGVRFKTLQVDYAFASEKPFGSTHRFGLTLRFARPKENPVFVAQRAFARGTRQFNRQRYTEALVEFNKALELDPSHPQALEMMKKTYESIKQNTNVLSPE